MFYLVYIRVIISSSICRKKLINGAIKNTKCVSLIWLKKEIPFIIIKETAYEKSYVFN